MFTGLIMDVGEVLDVRRSGDGVRLRIGSGLARQLEDGESIAVSGVCLTATAVDGDCFSADVMNETLHLSSLSEAVPGASVNLELAMRADQRFGGHIVQGHVDGLGAVSAVVPDGFSRRLTIAPADPGMLRYLALKGSITVDGVSLTVAGRDERSFTVALIPETIERTGLGRLKAGATVNLEVDVLAKYVERLMPGRAAE